MSSAIWVTTCITCQCLSVVMNSLLASLSACIGCSRQRIIESQIGCHLWCHFYTGEKEEGWALYPAAPLKPLAAKKTDSHWEPLFVDDSIRMRQSRRGSFHWCHNSGSLSTNVDAELSQRPSRSRKWRHRFEFQNRVPLPSRQLLPPTEFHMKSQV